MSHLCIAKHDSLRDSRTQSGCGFLCRILTVLRAGDHDPLKCPYSNSGW
jgi:hypothetical protein